VLWGLAVGLGLALAGPLAAVLTAEDVLNQGLAGYRAGLWDAITSVWSYLGSTEMVVGVCLVVSAIMLWRTHDWRLAVVAPIAILVQLLVYLGVTALIRRERPEVERLEVLLPMSSYPSGHVGAATALYLTFILLAGRIDRVWVRRLVIAVCVAIPLLVAFGRFYRGMHHVSDIVAGFGIGAACALLAYRWYRRRAGALELEDSHRSNPRT
jgi:membrane-associated phospholipid phosphatase